MLRSHDAGIRAQILRRRELSRGGPNDLPASRPQFSLLANDAINFPAIVGIEGRVVQNGVAVGEFGDNSVLGVAGNSVRVFIAPDLQRQACKFLKRLQCSSLQ